MVYIPFQLSPRQVEALLDERGIDIRQETVRQHYEHALRFLGKTVERHGTAEVLVIGKLRS